MFYLTQSLTRCKFVIVETILLSQFMFFARGTAHFTLFQPLVVVERLALACYQTSFEAFHDVSVIQR